jgi:DNA recombination protein RmuC
VIVLLTLLALVAGLAIGWLAASRAGEERLRAAVSEAAHARALVAAEQAAGQARMAAVDAARTDAREAIGDRAAELLESLERQLSDLERARIGAAAALREQVSSMTDASTRLRSETAALVTALRAPQVRGRWGEMQLERVVQAAGMAEHVDYVSQVTAADHDGGNVQRPDLVISLAAGKQVVVDSKVALAAYLDACEAHDERARTERLRAHARQVRSHVDALSAKAYWQRFAPSPEFVVCFVPADAVLDAALKHDPGLLEHAFERGVVLATPTTLLALLRTIGFGWRQEALARNAEAVHDLGRELYRRLATMGGHVDKLGRSLGAAVAAYNDAVGSLERRVLSTARRMTELGVVPHDETLPTPRLLTESLPRPLTTPELSPDVPEPEGRALLRVAAQPRLPDRSDPEEADADTPAAPASAITHGKALP